MISTCQRQRFLIRSTGHGAGPTIVIPAIGRLRSSAWSHVAADVASFAVAASVVPLNTTFARRTLGGYAGVMRPASSSSHEAVVVVRDGADDGVVGRHARLNQHTSALRAAPGPARHLAQELEAALGRAKVREVDADVRVDDADERHVRKV